MTASIRLTDQEETALDQIAQQTGKSADDLVREAVTHYIQHYHITHRRHLLQQARGMWHDRHDLPSFDQLRQEFDQL